MKDRIYSYHPGGFWLIFFSAVSLLAVKELFVLFGAGLFVQRAVGIAIGSITAYFLLVGLQAGRWMRVQSTWFRPIPADERARAEVAAALVKLPSTFFSFNHLRFENLEIDHMVLSPQGCLLIHTRGLSGQFLCNGENLKIDGKEADFLIGECWRQAHSFQEFIQRKLGKGVDVFPLLCLPRMSMEAPVILKGVTIADLKLLSEVISSYQKERIGKDFLFILSGFLARQKHGNIKNER